MLCCIRPPSSFPRQPHSGHVKAVHISDKYGEEVAVGIIAARCRATLSLALLGHVYKDENSGSANQSLNPAPTETQTQRTGFKGPFRGGDLVDDCTPLVMRKSVLQRMMAGVTLEGITSTCGHLAPQMELDMAEHFRIQQALESR